MFRTIILTLLGGLLFTRVLASELPIYEGARELDKKQSVVEKHHIALSKNKKVDGRWLFENELKLSGDLEQTLYQIETDEPLENVAAFYRVWVKQSVREVQFACEARLCGSSNQWANGFFHQKLLYGPDANQYYWVIKQGDIYWVLYLIERGNKRIYLYTERLQTQVVIAWFNLQIPDHCLIDSAFVEKNSLLAENKGFEYLLVVSIAGVNTLQASQTKANECLSILSKVFPALKIQAIGLGEFSSSLDKKVKTDRIELIRLNE